MFNKKIKNPQEVKNIVSAYKRKGKTIAFTNGCFDILHAGHIEYLKAAKKFADILIVALNTDSSVKMIKGPSRPIMNLKDRQKIIAALENVDYVTSFSEATPAKLISRLRPDFVIKGGDWKIKDIVGARIIAPHGGKAISVKYKKGYSSTGIINKIVRNFG